ncbi:MAG: hypothetical protein V1862_13375 [Methanobacteriota archaeon]
MQICVLNGSPKGEKSVTMQYQFREEDEKSAGYAFRVEYTSLPSR